MNAFFNSQFSYCQLIWMCHSHIINKKINKLHGRCLRIIYGDKQSSFEELLETLRATLKYKERPSILAIQNTYKNQIKFTFEEMDLSSIKKEICNLKINKVSQSRISRPKL